ncbi:MAG: S-layer homology domain-containing protein [Acidimicrobiaceae bacterium]|nr:S-layer homology domain-containing protein [Acidimicrobiaceae bacterium]
MLQRFSKMRSRWATLAVGALVASLLAVNATTATAVTDTPDERARVNVCVGEALEDWDFTDVSDDHIFHDAINCLAHYGVTIGTGDGSTFSPEDPVERWQMMLFLTRALIPTGINLSPARGQNFTDLGHLNDEARDAIDLLVTNGIATATSGRTFEPFAYVDRAEMALLLVRLLDAAGDVVTFNNVGDILLDANDDGIQTEPDDYFKDARDLVPVATDQAISAAYELGITTGVDPTPAVGTAQPGLDLFYRPRSPVTRGQMAAFILRTLGHTMARPRGLSAQYDGSEIRVSLRDDDFEPISDAPIDMFFIETEDANRAFQSNGRCRDVEFVDGAYACEIDDSDLTTDDDGEVSLTVPETVFDGIDTTVWVWTGRDRDVADTDDTDLFRLDIEPSEQTQGAAKAKISTGFRGSKARFGDTVTLTVQLQDSRGNDVRVGEDGERPAEWDLVEEVLIEAADDVDGDLNGTGESLWTRSQPRTLRSDSRGRITFSLRVSDPNRGATGDSRTRTFLLTPGTNAPGAFEADANLKKSSGRTDGDRYYLEFSDADPVLANSVVTITTTDRYINAPTGDSARNTAEVTAHNEYGEPLSGATFTLSSDKSQITTQSFTFSRGVRRVAYSYDGNGKEIETLTATVDPDGSTTTSNNLDAVNAYVFWPDLTSEFNSADITNLKVTGTPKRAYILFGDLDRDEIIVDTNNTDNSGTWPVGVVPERVEYDDNDRFDVQGANDAEPRAVRNMEIFERALAQYLAVAPTADAGTGACLEWEDFRRERDTAVIRLWHTCP